MALDDDVGGVHEVPEHLQALRRLEVEHDAALAAVHVDGPDRLRGAAWVVDGDHVGAELGQRPAAGGPREYDAEIEDSNAFEDGCDRGRRRRGRTRALAGHRRPGLRSVLAKPGRAASDAAGRAP